MKHKYNRHPNQYSQSDLRGLSLLIIIMMIGAYLNYRFSPQPDPINPFISHSCGVAKVYASEKVVVTPVTIEDKIRATFPEDPDMAVRIAKCESGMRANAFNGKNRNGSWDAGVMQINSIHGYSKEYLFDVDNNLKVARKLYNRQGWRPWVCARSK